MDKKNYNNKKMIEYTDGDSSSSQSENDSALDVVVKKQKS